MTEAEWLTCAEPFELLDSVEEAGAARKTRLFADACCRRIARFLAAAPSRNAIDVSDLYADDSASEGQLIAALSKADAAAEHGGQSRHLSHPDPFVTDVIIGVMQTMALSAGGTPSHDATREAYRAESEAHASLLRDIFGNPLRPVAFSPSWRTDTAVSLARTMYDTRDFSAMPILADALQDAGCDNEDVLAHCRGPGPHVRGCWVVDSVLGKS
jgi:hypothetical protein